MKKTLLALALCTASLAHAGPRGWIDIYNDFSTGRVERCAKTYLLSWDEASFYEQGNDCVRESREKIKSYYSDALGQVSKGAREPFKNHLIKMLSALEGTKPLDSETRSAYSTRLGRSREALNEAWVRFDLEQK